MKYHAARKWIILSLVLGSLFLIGTIIYVTGVLFLPTLLVERWLLLRPETGIDCVLVEWRNLGEVPTTLILTALLGIVCVLEGYRRRVLPLLLLLLLLSVGIEGVGKLSISVPLSLTLRSAMTDLSCPQFAGKSQLFKLEVGLAMVNKVPAQSPGMIRWSHTVAAMPIDLTTSVREHSYPSGHAARWSFIWFLAAWLAQRHIRPRLLGGLLAALLFVFAFMGGFIQFYTGVHFISDVLAGYLLGGALACAAIAVVLLNSPGEKVAQLTTVFTDRESEQKMPVKR
jgi:membrane-associated phospholipid phosphatase